MAYFIPWIVSQAGLVRLTVTSRPLLNRVSWPGSSQTKSCCRRRGAVQRTKAVLDRWRFTRVAYALARASTRPSLIWGETVSCEFKRQCTAAGLLARPAARAFQPALPQLGRLPLGLVDHERPAADVVGLPKIFLLLLCVVRQLGLQ